MPFFLTNIFTGYIRKLIMDVITERVERYKETLKIMSLRNSAYITGTLIYSYLMGLCVTTVYCLTTYNIQEYQNYGG